ncbi:1-acyl-sn-glycerol-3-phosphate-acyltransferase [Mycena epipterygia]|nr:1-acyl-sn-glycerol-3-phosphate-acyltransferase [Mycena epipterygia]
MTATGSFRYYARMGVYLATMSFWGFAGTAVGLVMSLVGRRFTVSHIIARTFYIFIGWVLGLRVELEGTEHLATQPAVLMINHQSALDVWLLGSVMPNRVSVMAKKSLGYTPIGPALYLSGAIFVDRGSGARAVASIRKAGATLRTGGISLVVFPEGTRNASREPSLLPFKKGGFHMAVQSGLPILPIVCENYSHMYRHGYFEPVTISARVLPPVLTTGLGVEDVSELTARVQEQMLVAVRDLSRRA